MKKFYEQTLRFAEHHDDLVSWAIAIVLLSPLFILETLEWLGKIKIK